ncbi:hypothetical protein BDV95DRAFT_280268 [Massariosphaeria phaeospora]|uniref:N-acetyltransferase domain-containing protein n=1 Tax=Massariosphaeria phaeospora TaxID=100035 RepID=A0A7C8MAT0_9PLEO|nr:hypothetical protein BDV95DRAFT_280268 [Massariosphaeria phaeospora]
MATNITSEGVRIESIENADDFQQAFQCAAECFGKQTKDGFWCPLNPGWDTPKGAEEGAARFANRWRETTTNKDGRPNTVFLKATVPDPNAPGHHVIAGFAIWQQASFVDGYGDPPASDLGSGGDYLEPTARRFCNQAFGLLWKQRIQTAKEKMNADPPAIFVLDLCVVDPAFQRRGIAGKLVQWGLDEAKRRGGLELTTEASVMGRPVYARLGFRGEEKFIETVLDEEFKDRALPPNVFMRTGGTPE